MLTKEDALELFQENPFKIQTIKGKVPDGAKVTAYRCGDLIDLCTGPHIPSTGLIKAFKVMKNSSAYWLGNNENDSLQRVYAISFPSKAQMDEYIKNKEEAEKRDHRRVGKRPGFSPRRAKVSPPRDWVSRNRCSPAHPAVRRGLLSVATPSPLAERRPTFGGGR